MRCPCGTTATVRVKSFHLCRRPNDTERQHLLCRDFKRRSGSKINRHHEVKARSVCLCRDDGEPVFYLLGGGNAPLFEARGDSGCHGYETGPVFTHEMLHCTHG